MAYIKVDISRLNQLESQLNRLPGCINSTNAAVKSVRSSLDWDVACEDRIDKRLNNITSSLADCGRRMQNTVRFLDDAAIKYSKVESGGEKYKTGNGSSGSGRSTVSFDKFHGGNGRSFDIDFNPAEATYFQELISATKSLNLISKWSSAILTGGVTAPFAIIDTIKDGKEVANFYGKLIDTYKTGADAVVNNLGYCAAYWYNNYTNKGWSYKTVKTGKAVIAIAASTAGLVVTWTAAIGATGATAGIGGTAAIPLAMLGSIYSLNTIANSTSDIMNCWVCDVEQVGEVNFLKQRLETNTGVISEMIGGTKETGEKIGNVIYSVGDLTSTIYGVDKTTGAVNKFGKIIDKATQTPYELEDVSQAITDTKETMGNILNLAAFSNIEDIPGNFVVLKESYDSVRSITAGAEIINDGVDIGRKIIDSGIDIAESITNYEFVRINDIIPQLGGVDSLIKNGEKVIKTVDKLNDITI